MLRVDHVEPNRFTEDDARLVMAFADQASVAIESARLQQQARRVAALEERQRLARELHDSLSQALYGIVLGIKTAQAMLARSPADAAEPLEYVHSLAESSFAEMRALIFELRPDSLETRGFVAALTRQVEILRARHEITVHAELCEEPALPIDRKEALYRIAQEALNNVTKYAHARHVTLRLAQPVDTIVLEVIDDGIGFDTAAPTPGHLGLRTMREHAERARRAHFISRAQTKKVRTLKCGCLLKLRAWIGDRANTFPCPEQGFIHGSNPDKPEPDRSPQRDTAPHVQTQSQQVHTGHYFHRACSCRAVFVSDLFLLVCRPDRKGARLV